MAEVPVSEIDDNDTRPALVWISADGQRSLDMEGQTLASAKAELLDQCGSDEKSRSNILAGSIEIAA